jgi:cytochrome bd ubiquinol oxidase subunit II
MSEETVLPLVFTALMGAAILAYVVLDGYDLGVGMLMPAAERDEQEIMVNSIGPFWDANETWLVLGIGLLLVAFPLAHGEVLGALYLPVAAMLVGLMVRGTAFEFRIKALGWHRELWNWLFWAGSFLASFAQGLMLGRYITGFSPGLAAWLFALVVAGGVCGGYVLLGATWLVMKTEGALQQKAIAWARWGLGWVALGVALVSIATPLASETVRQKWFSYPNFVFLSILPISTIAAGIWTWVSLGKSDLKPFAGAVAIYFLAFAGLAYSLFPYLVMDRITIWDAAAHPSALKFVLVGTLVVAPFIVGYTWYVYRVFAGKAKGGSLYGEEKQGSP